MVYENREKKEIIMYKNSEWQAGFNTDNIIGVPTY